MALSLTTIKNQVLTNLYGRRLGLIKTVSGDDNSEVLAGVQGFKHPYTDATSDTTGTDIVGYGVTVVDTTTDDTWLMDAPIPGVYKTLYFGSTSTGIRTIKRDDGTWAIRTTAASTNTTIVAQAGGHSLVLFGLTTALYGIVSRVGSTEIAFNGTT